MLSTKDGVVLYSVGPNGIDDGGAKLGAEDLGSAGGLATFYWKYF